MRAMASEDWGNGTRLHGRGLLLVVFSVLMSCGMIGITGDGLPMRARLTNKHLGPAIEGHDGLYRRLSNKGMFGGDVKSGIGLSENVSICPLYSLWFLKQP